jgi:ATP-dependent Lon protease
VSDYAVRELPLFPLPDVVLFPQQLLPLHIFESRYRMLLQSVLEHGLFRPQQFERVAELCL